VREKSLRPIKPDCLKGKTQNKGFSLICDGGGKEEKHIPAFRNGWSKIFASQFAQTGGEKRKIRRRKRRVVVRDVTGGRGAGGKIALRSRGEGERGKKHVSYLVGGNGSEKTLKKGIRNCSFERILPREIGIGYPFAYIERKEGKPRADNLTSKASKGGFKNLSAVGVREDLGRKENNVLVMEGPLWRKAQKGKEGQ